MILTRRIVSSARIAPPRVSWSPMRTRVLLAVWWLNTHRGVLCGNRHDVFNRKQSGDGRWLRVCSTGRSPRGEWSGSDFTSMMINGKDNPFFIIVREMLHRFACTRIYVFHARSISLYRLYNYNVYFEFKKKISIISIEQQMVSKSVIKFSLKLDSSWNIKCTF